MNKNPFMDMFGNMMNMMPMMNNMQNMMNSFKMPNNMDNMMNTMNMKKVMDSVYNTNQTITSCAQAVMRVQSEAMQNNVAALFDNVKDFSSMNPENGMQKQTQVFQNLMENALNSTKEVAEVMGKVCLEMFDQMGRNLNECMNDNMSNFATATAHATGKKKSH